jgi:hypothetical protein
MGIYTDYFVAASDELAASVLNGGPSEDAPDMPAVQAKGMIPAVIMARLEEILTGRDYNAVLGDPRHGLELAADDDGVWVVALTRQLRDALAISDEQQLRSAGVRLAATAEVHARDADDVAGVVDVVVELGALARTAAERGHGLYCWMCL